jgi:hypothetical protein
MTSPATASSGNAPAASGRKESRRDPPHFDWPLAYAAENLLRERTAAFQGTNTFTRQLAERMQAETGTDFFEWIDHLAAPPEDEVLMRAVGYIRETSADAPDGEIVLVHPRATLPRVVVRPGAIAPTSVIAIRPERVAAFKARHNLSGDIEGPPCSRYRRLVASVESGTRLEVVERRSYRGFIPMRLKPGQLDAIVKVRELWQTRQRFFAEDADGFKVLNRLLDVSIPLVGRDLTCQIFFEAERAYWESRNRAARIQKFRQDRLGLGWGNHDHHTFRSSRRHFVDLIEFLMKLGFEKRERFHAGTQAGWGAQICEQETTGIVVFADVDLTPEETEVDFSAERLPPSDKLGTVGLWVGLHGESLLGAGMHHLEARFDHHLLREQLKGEGVNMMAPFSDFDFLRQAFTEGERWPVSRDRAEGLRSAGLITHEQFERFVKDGAIGSHLENLQRHGGFKGFNQASVSAVISATDPRKSAGPHGAA